MYPRPPPDDERDNRAFLWLIFAACAVLAIMALSSCQTIADNVKLPTASTNVTQTAWGELSDVLITGQQQSRLSQTETEWYCYGTDDRPTPGQFGVRQWKLESIVAYKVWRIVPVWRNREWPQLVDQEQTRNEQFWSRKEGAKWVRKPGVTP